MQHHIKKIFRNQRWILILLSLFGFLFHFVFTAILSTAEIRSFANNIYQLIPPVFRNMAGFGDSVNLMSNRLIAFGYNHPTALLMLMFIPISTASRYISAEIENRTVDILLIRMYPRYRMITGTLMFCVVAHATIYICMFLGTSTGRIVFGLQEEFGLVPILKIIGIGFLFYTAISSIVIFIAVNNRERGRTISMSAGFFLFFYVLDVISRIWDKAAFLQPFSLFNLYRSGDIAAGNFNFIQTIITLLLLIIFFLSASILLFRKKDL